MVKESWTAGSTMMPHSFQRCQLAQVVHAKKVAWTSESSGSASNSVWNPLPKCFSSFRMESCPKVRAITPVIASCPSLWWQVFHLWATFRPAMNTFAFPLDEPNYLTAQQPLQGLGKLWLMLRTVSCFLSKVAASSDLSGKLAKTDKKNQVVWNLNFPYVL